MTIKRSYGDIVLQGDSFDEIVTNLKSVPEWLDVVDSLILKSESPTSKKDFLKGILEFTSDGTVVTVAKDRISDKDAICLVIYGNEPAPLQPKEIARLLTISGRLSAGFGARLSELRNEGLILKDGSAYRLTATGKTTVEGLIARVRG